ncbi:murein hydrolase activator EnvC [Plesiomonas shigelloides]|uniref:AmiB activator n=2 Tax=Plesiomonas shigelloides TaxID=703 RepID=R8ALS4_PLESH|nr:murein hydrolase activator EnvC [Plesiomonas shigelloides]EON87286.1 AmiB activator [Plesiomonas shigelloides 302-73]KAB7667430.1 murein hydrolase activator EnvC [Plesiomonas shigelloides]KAB7692157.1 murein hydrolase activator EnvC [Plesiomonas shigelloides]KAB7702758.1 murein hydrolase activator EnvC [Plesiomonas shigelloides]KAB7710060.1 murein hydrolase activator EnvC [Plesiomonas shigelloides]
MLNTYGSRISQWCTGALCTGMLLCAPYAPAAPQSALQGVQQEIAQQASKVAAQQDQRQQLQQALRKQDQSISSASKALRQTEQRLTRLTRDLKRLTTSISELEKQQQQHQQRLAAQLDAAYRQGKQGQLQAMLSSDDPARAERMLHYYRAINEERQAVMNEISVNQHELQQQKDELQAKQKEQATLLGSQKQQQDKLQQARTERKKTLSALEADLQQNQQKLAQLKQNEQRLRDQIARAEREAKARAEREARELARKQAAEEKRTGKPYVPNDRERALMAQSGGLGRPAGQHIWPVRGSILHRFGDSQEGELRWKGMVIAAPEGSEVRAIADGKVLLADWLQGYGLVMVVEHGKGDMSLYGYNQTVLFQPGDNVKAGQPIALVGDSGGQGSAGLYFEIRRQGQAVNPRPWLGG